MEETLFMIHSMFGRPTLWDEYVDFFENKGYRCVTPVLRYHDAEPDEPCDPRLGTTSLLDYAEDLGQDEERPIVMGHSMGGLLAQMVASRGLARALVLLTPAPPAGNAMILQPSVLRTFLRLHARWGFWRKPTRLRYNEAVFALLHRLPPDQQRARFSDLVCDSGRAMFEIGCWFLDPKGASRVAPSSVTCPVLVIGGGQDRMVPPSLVRPIAERYGDAATYREFASHSHWILEEEGWEYVAAYVHQWLLETLSGEA